jgi:hypothetical protein
MKRPLPQRQKDRDAVLLQFLENKTFKEVGADERAA